MQKYLTARIAQTILLLPSTLTVGLMLLVSAMVPTTAGPGAVLNYFQSLGWSGGIAATAGLLILTLIVLLLVSGFALLWFLVWNGPSYFADHRWLGILAIGVAVLSLVIGVWLISRMVAPPTRNLLTTVLVCGPPVLLGTVHSATLCGSVIRGRKIS